MPPSKRSRSARTKNGGRVPLADEIAATGPLRQQQRGAKRKSDARDDDEDDGDGDGDKDSTGKEGARNGFVDTKASRKILKISRDLVTEDEERVAADAAAAASDAVGAGSGLAFSLASRETQSADADEDDFEYGDDGEEWGDEEEEVEELDVDPQEMEMFNKFMPSEPEPLEAESGIKGLEAPVDGGGSGTNLADLILEKIAAQEAMRERRPVTAQEEVNEDNLELHPKVIQVYTTIGQIMSRYKSGKFPKPFKVIHTLPQWQELLELTRPDTWTPNACLEATRIFMSAKPAIAQVFLETVILDRVREDIHETRKLNVHFYNALKKALFKPAAFFKGFLFPLVDSGTCTLREAHIISSALVRVSIPVLHSAAALLRLTEIAAEQTMASSSENAGATNIFIRVLLQKKYALPYKVVDGLVFHFLRFRAVSADQMRDEDENSALAAKEAKLPVLWHQCLLAFAQRYRNDITEDQREALLDLLLSRSHHDIGPEIRRELLEGRGRGVPVPGELGDANDDTMVVDGV